MEAILKPYVKQFDKNRVVRNPISKYRPYLHQVWMDEKGILHQYPNRRERRAFERNKI